MKTLTRIGIGGLLLMLACLGIVVGLVWSAWGRLAAPAVEIPDATGRAGLNTTTVQAETFNVYDWAAANEARKDAAIDSVPEVVAEVRDRVGKVTSSVYDFVTGRNR